MGIIARQSIKNSAIIYLGTALGYVNTVLLFPYFLTTTQFGLVQVLLAISTLFVQVGDLGISRATVRYFPYFRNREKQHHGFFFFVLLTAISGYLAFALLFYYFRNHFFQLFSADAELISGYYLLLFPLALSTVLHHLTLSYCQALFKTVIPVFIREVGLRMYICGLLIVYTTGVLHFPDFMILFVGGYVLHVIVMFLYLIWLGELHLRPSLHWHRLGLTRDIFVYGFYTILNKSSIYAFTHLDALMVGMLLTLSDVAIYKVAFFIGMVINIPARGMRQIAVPMIAASWEKNNLPNIDSIYKKTSLTLFITGALIFTGIWANIDTLFHMLPADKGYAEGKLVFLFIGLAMLINMLGGVNRAVIVTSIYYRFNFIASLVLVLMIVLTNLWLVPLYGINGAALATLVSLSCNNIINILFIKYRFNLLPFTPNTIKAILISAGVFLLGISIPPLPILWADLILRSTVILCVFTVLILYFNVSEDANQLWHRVQLFLKDMIHKN